MSDLFISYSHESTGFVAELVSKLRQNNYDVWYDENIPVATEDWRKDIDQAILECKLVILVMTPDANRSPYVTFEWSYALGIGKKILLVWRQQTENIHPRLSTHQRVEFTDKSYKWDKLYAAIESILENERARNETNIRKDSLISIIVDLIISDSLTRHSLFKFADRGMLNGNDIIQIRSKVSNLNASD